MLQEFESGIRDDRRLVHMGIGIGRGGSDIFSMDNEECMCFWHDLPAVLGHEKSPGWMTGWAGLEGRRREGGKGDVEM